MAQEFKSIKDNKKYSGKALYKWFHSKKSCNIVRGRNPLQSKAAVACICAVDRLWTRHIITEKLHLCTLKHLSYLQEGMNNQDFVAVYSQNIFIFYKGVCYHVGLLGSQCFLYTAPFIFISPCLWNAVSLSLILQQFDNWLVSGRLLTFLTFLVVTLSNF